MNKHLKRAPHKLSSDVWWYEESHGISVVMYQRVIKISWRSLRAALARKDKRDE